MRTFLVPTDFSENADTALYYAIELAKSEDAKIILLHIFTTPGINLVSTEKQSAKLKKESDNELQKLGLRIKHAGGIDYEYFSVEGSAVKVILDTIKEKKIDLLIIGTKGETKLSHALFGSNTAKLIAQVECPVIAVPGGASFKPIKKITYATNYLYGDIFILKKVLKVAQPYQAQINILHISTKEETPLAERESMEKFMTAVKSEINYFNLSFQMLHGKNIEEQLENYIHSGATDLIVMATDHRGAFEQIFSESLTKTLASKTNIPLMVFHLNKKLSGALL